MLLVLILFSPFITVSLKVNIYVPIRVVRNQLLISKNTTFSIRLFLLFTLFYNYSHFDRWVIH